MIETVRRPRRWWPTLPIAALTLLGAVSCGSSDDTSSATTTEAASAASTTVVADGDDAAAEPCVTDIDQVIATQPTPESTTAELPADLVSQLEAAATISFAEAATPGAIVGVRTPAGTWIDAYGVADPATGTPMATDMNTRIGSVTKTFTGTVIMQLVQEGEISLDDTIDDYVPDVPNGDVITLRQIATMTSGIASYTVTDEFQETLFNAPETVWTVDQLLALGLGASPIFEPGEKFNYSNTNTVLLGIIIEQIAGQSVKDTFQERIFEPLGLTHTTWPGDSPVIPEPYPQGFTLQGVNATPEAPENATNWNPSWGWTAGELISGMDDLLIYGRALGTGQGLLDAETQADRLTAWPEPAGYGIQLGCIDGWVGHTGELPGYNTSVYYDTTSDTTVVVQVNSDIPSGDCAESATLIDDPGEAVCSSPATRMFVALSAALGHEFQPNPQS